jgi:hypothetical protein
MKNRETEPSAQKYFLTLMICLLSISGLAQTGSAPPPAGMVGWWPGDGDARNILGDSPSLDGVLMNGASANAAGLVGKAFSFDGIDSYVVLPNLVQAQPEGTVEFWFKLNTWDWRGAPAGRYLWSSTLNLPDTGFHTDGVNLGCHVGYTGTGELMFGVWETPATLWHWARSGVTPDTNVWYHVAGTWGPSGVCIYINGALSGFEPYTGPTPDYLQHNLLGCSSWPNSFTDGLIDEFSIYSLALSPDEISAIYAAGSAGKLKPVPQLKISSSGGAVLVWWPTNSSGYLLETSPDLEPHSRWAAFASQPLVVGDQNLIVAKPNKAGFFRLHKP